MGKFFTWLTGLALLPAHFATAAVDVPLPSAKPGSGLILPVPVARVLPEKQTKKAKRSASSNICPVVAEGLVSATSIAPIRQGQCGHDKPLEVSEVRGISIKPAAKLNCKMATSLADWVGEMKVNAKRHLKQDVVTIRNAASYACRRRNNGRTGKLSEHAKLNALDVSAFILENGDKITVLDDWKKGKKKPRKKSARFLKESHTSACKIFKTVLGPESDRHHQSHFHFDLGCHGKTCTARVCR